VARPEVILPPAADYALKINRDFARAKLSIIEELSAVALNNPEVARAVWLFCLSRATQGDLLSMQISNACGFGDARRHLRARTPQGA
jgi:hypothetical protein